MEPAKPNSTFNTPLYQLAGAAAATASLIQDILDNTEMQNAERDLALGDAMAALENTQEAIEVKIENCIKYVKSLVRQQDMIAEEESSLAQKRKQIEAAETRLRDYIKDCLKRMEGHKLKAPCGSATWFIKKNARLEITDEQLLPTDKKFWRFHAPDLDKKAVKEAMEAGEAIGGCKLIDSEVLTIR